MKEITGPARNVPLDHIRPGVARQVRVSPHRRVIEGYAREMREGAAFPPVVVFYEGESDTYWLADGYHRVEAARLAGLTGVEADIRHGTERDAILYAVAAN